MRETIDKIRNESEREMQLQIADAPEATSYDMTRRDI
jgi:hypothetical protein